MHFNKYIFILVAGLLMACSNIQRTEKPKNLIPEDQMVNILVDMAKIKAAKSINSQKYDDRNPQGKEMIFKKYSIDSTQLMRSTIYYAEQYTVNNRIYEKVTDRLQAESDSLYALEKERREAKNKKDSTQNKLQ